MFSCEETLLRKATAGKLGNVFLFRYRFLFVTEKRQRERWRKMGLPAAFP
jgi:hypothetical protein